MAEGLVNTETGEPWSLRTIGYDIVALQKQWEKEAQKDIIKHKARELAELGEHRKSAWGQREIGEVRLGIALEMKLLGTAEPERKEITGAEGEPLLPIAGLIAALRGAERILGDDQG